jgi:23S rRNA (cytosine1962-C5)-methyltransferase
MAVTAVPNAVVNQRGAERLRFGHPWIYRSDVIRVQSDPAEIVRVTDERGRFLGSAFYSDRSQITLRFISREDRPIDRAFFTERLVAAARYRQQVVSDTDCFRLFYGESDQIPGLVVDRYGDYLSIQTLSQTTDRQKPLLVEILQELFAPKGIIERNDPRVRLLEGLEQKVSVLAGTVPEKIIARENGIQFQYDLFHGQKTGSFLDQRENHRAARQFASGEVLDCCCFGGGFSLTLASAAAHVEGVDMSAAAIATARENQALNDLPQVEFREANIFDLLKKYDEVDRPFDMVVLDPPAFAKNRDSLPAAIRGYKEINLRAIKILRPGGYLVTCSCSHHLPEAAFLQLIAEAGTDAKRAITIVERRTQAKDHPILLTMPETHYLKCMILRVLD